MFTRQFAQSLDILKYDGIKHVCNSIGSIIKFCQSHSNFMTRLAPLHPLYYALLIPQCLYQVFDTNTPCHFAIGVMSIADV